MEKRRKLEAVIFDFGEVIGYGVVSRKLIFKKLLERKGIKKPLKEIKKVFNHQDKFIYNKVKKDNTFLTKKSDWICVNSMILKRLGIEDKNNKLANYINYNWDSLVKIKLYSDVVPAIKKLKHLGLRLGIITNANWTEEQFERRVKIINKYFDFLISPFTDGTRKPFPNIYLLAIKKLKLKPSKIAFVDDSINYLKGAEAVGLLPILLDRRNKIKNSKFVKIRTLKQLIKLI
jgi:HAD superfamily hydrolase (TIGR01549 family)